jgi:dTDP-3-amino-3,4,6-trideoxy-alpha-D-glucose transaminase
MSVATSGQAKAPSVTTPFLDLEPAFDDGVREAILEDIEVLLRTHAYANGPQVPSFEEAFAAFIGTAECVGLASGHDALRLALLAKGIERGEEVIVPANTFIATFEAVSQAGGVPVPVDVSESDYNLDPAAVESALTERTRYLIPVHLYGTPADLPALGMIAERRGLHVLEDACQAHGAERDGLRVGAFGFAAAFSFYPAKNLGAIGDAGAVTTSDVALAERLRALREHGQRRKYRHEVAGFTSRLDTIQAIVLLRKLPHLDRLNADRSSAAQFYSDALQGVGDLRLPQIASDTRPAWHLYVIRTAEPQRMAEYLAERGIGTGRHYPQPPHLSPAYASLGYSRGDFPVAETLADEVLSLPMFPGITEAQLHAVVEAVTGFFRNG